MKVPLAIYLLCAIMFGNVESIDFEKARSKAYDLINLIYQRYEFHVFNQYQFFIGSLNMNTKTWDMMKYKFASKIVSQSTFLMTFGGSSVTAGHDNYFNQSFPIVFEHRMKPIFNHLNVDLQVHNIAMGANGCRPSNYCYETQGGDNPDWIQWEQSFNCGKDKGVFELIARVAGWSRAVLFYSASGGYIPTDCKEPAGGAVSWVSEEWTPEKVGIQSKYSANYTHLKSLLNEWYEDTSSAERFAGPLGDKYLRTGAHGYSVWTHYKQVCWNFWNNVSSCNAVDMRGSCHQWGGPHWNSHDFAVYGSLSGSGRNWHPTKGIHLLRGELLAYNYAHILLDAMDMVETDKKTKSKDSMLAEYQAILDELQPPMTETILHCHNECETKPTCWTNYEPHYNDKYFLDELVVGTHEGWSKHSGKLTDEHAIYGYLDKKHFYQASNAETSEIHVKVRVGKARLLRVCGDSNKESLKHAHFFIDYNVTDAVFNKSVDYVPGPNRVPIPHRRYVGDECTEMRHLEEGKHVLTMQTNTKEPRHWTSFSHVIEFA